MSDNSKETCESAHRAILTRYERAIEDATRDYERAKADAQDRYYDELRKLTEERHAAPPTD